jgi:hypothetical protein
MIWIRKKYLLIRNTDFYFFNVVFFLCVFSRIFRGNELYKAQAVTFLDSPDGKTATGTPFKSKAGP